MKRRVAIYARFSSDRQNERSSQDQIDLCRAWAERQGDLVVVSEYRDEAISGASAVNRMGLARMMRDARAKAFDVLLAEDIDRIARSQADLHSLRDDLTFLGIGIMTVSDGTITAMHAGLKGLMGEMFLADLAAKTRRGQAATVRAGGVGGGRSYGYLPAAQAGQLTIVEEEADIIRRIFREYLDGKVARDIAGGLNAERIPGPRGGRWNASTIAGSKARQNGVLQNRLYVGEIVWNRQRFIKDPSTGKRVSRPNDRKEWLVVPAPQLAIVDQGTFARVQEQREARGNAPYALARPPKHLLSGLLKCGCCGASYTIVNNDRIGCAGFRERQDCSNGRTVTRKHVEDRVLKALLEHVINPEAVEEYIRGVNADTQRLAKASRRDSTKLQHRMTDLTLQIERIVDRIVDGTATAALEARLPAMEAEKAQLLEEIARASSKTVPIALHPATARHFARVVAEAADLVRAGTATADTLAAVRRFIERVEIHPKGKGPVDISVSGPLAVILSSEIEDTPEYRVRVVAGARNTSTPMFCYAA